MSNAWKITIPVQRSEERPDGRYIIGEASGPENDGHGSRMSPEAIIDFARQISDRVDAGDPIPYIDQHLKSGVLRELGHVMEGTVDSKYHLTVAVRLDESNPASNYLYQKVRQGKQYGMSVAGDGTDFVIERDDTGNRIVTFIKVVLREISNTTRPSWVPSFGTVLARSLDHPEGESEMTEEVAAPVVETVATEPTVEETIVENSETETPQETTDSTVVVERARIAAKDSAEVAALYAEFTAKLTALGIDLSVAAPEVTPETAAVETAVENSETGDETVDFAGVKVERELAAAITAYIATEVERSVAPLAEQVEKQSKYIEELEPLPAGKQPAPVVREKFEGETTGPDLDKMSPVERLHYGLSGLYGTN